MRINFNTLLFANNSISDKKSINNSNAKIDNKVANTKSFATPTIDNLRAYHISFAGRQKNSSFFNTFMLAVAMGNAPAIRQWVKDDLIYINEESENHITPLLSAIDKRHDEIVDILLTHRDIDVNKRMGDTKHTPIMFAVASDNTNIVRSLLNHKNINPNVSDEGGITPLMLASSHNNIEIVKELLKHKDIDVMRKDENGVNAFVYAFDNIEILKLLLEQDNIDVNSPLVGNKSLLGLALSMGHLDAAKLIYQHNLKNGLN